MRCVFDAWNQGGRVPQPGVAWPVERWRSAFPQEDLFWNAIPRDLDRDDVRRMVLSELTIEQRFLVVMVWGFGRVGYGPWRAQRALAEVGASNKLETAVDLLHTEGALSAYRFLGTGGRLPWLGPAFATKFLFFVSKDVSVQRPLILDAVVARSIQRSGGQFFNPGAWSSRIYGEYLDVLHGWADSLGCPADELERCLFMAEASGQWTAKPES